MSTGDHVPSNSGVEAVAASEGGLPRDAYTLLAQANLMRMRGQWPEAVEKCMKALKLSPDNASAQSLLGDIYENQGLLDDAIQWYRMALDVCPDSPADKMKLARVIESKSRTLPPPAPFRQALPSPSGPEPRRTRDAEVVSTPPLSLAERFPAASETLLRRSAYGAGALTLLVILFALAFTRWSVHAGKADGQLSVPTVVLPSLGTGAPNVTPAPPTVYSAPPSDPAEQDLLNALRSVPNMSVQGIAFVGVESDPRAGRLTLTVTCQSPTATPARDLVLRDALMAAEAAVQVTSAQAYPQFSVRCLEGAPVGGGSTPLLLVADTTRTALAGLPANPSSASSSQIMAAFSNPWWSSVVSP